MSKQQPAEHPNGDQDRSRPEAGLTNEDLERLAGFQVPSGSVIHAEHELGPAAQSVVRFGLALFASYIGILLERARKTGTGLVDLEGEEEGGLLVDPFESWIFIGRLDPEDPESVLEFEFEWPKRTGPPRAAFDELRVTISGQGLHQLFRALDPSEAQALRDQIRGQEEEDR